ncbi:MAG: nitrile hydratase subunit beta [Alphaproteobacteria bacterium]|nr:nitrile hydratase subunit beta [Alphaproteobacteria bacterium]
MNGLHDMGGMMGFGPIEREAHEPVFHADWERRMFALVSAVGYAVPFNDDHLRREIERTPPAEYLTSTYYELWYRALVSVLEERRAVSREELAGARPRPLPPSVQIGPALAAGKVVAAIAAGASARRDARVPPRFTVGDRVRARDLNPAGHTRLPRYVRGRPGVITRDHGVFSFNDSNARGDGEQPQHVHAVCFAMRDLWGPAASAGDHLYLDLWDDHLEPA